MGMWIAVHSDNFNRGDGLLGNPAYKVTDLFQSFCRIISNHVDLYSGPTTARGGQASNSVYVDDQYSQALVWGSDNNLNINLGIRDKEGVGTYVMQIFQSGYALVKSTSGGAETALVGWQPWSLSGTEVIRLEAVGTDIIVYKDGQQVTSSSDSTYTEGEPAFGGYMAGTRTAVGFDDWEGGHMGEIQVPKFVKPITGHGRARGSEV